jgi:hypothetical protein
MKIIFINNNNNNMLVVMEKQNVLCEVGGHLLYICCIVLSCSQSQNGLEKDANYIESRSLGFGAVSLNKYFPTFRILVGPLETTECYTIALKGYVRPLEDMASNRSGPTCSEKTLLHLESCLCAVFCVPVCPCMLLVLRPYR